MRISIGNITIALRNTIHPFIIIETKNGWYSKNFKTFKKQLGENSGFPLYKNYPCLNDRDADCGDVMTPYFQQDMYVARKIFEKKPHKHVDIGSSMMGFVAHVAVFREIEVFDIRPMNLTVPNIKFTKTDLTDTSSLPDAYCDSISCLHALEHFGLGRYGDKIDSNGHLKGFRNITKILKPGGTFYFSVPMGVQRIEFNAHRIFGMPYLMEMISTDYDIVSFAYIDDNCLLHTNVELSKKTILSSFDCNHGCAIFELRKK